MLRVLARQLRKRRSSPQKAELGAHCPWCQRPWVDPTATCAGCGAPIDVRAAGRGRGWQLLPGVPQMSLLQCGRSTCQVLGRQVPVADWNLAAGEGVFFPLTHLLWKDDAVSWRVINLGAEGSTIVGSMPLNLIRAGGPGRIALSRDEPGELLAIALNEGDQVDVRLLAFVAAAGRVAYTWNDPDVWVREGWGIAVGIEYPAGRTLDQFSAPDGPGLLLIHGEGDVRVRRLAEGESVLVQPGAFLFKDSSVEMSLHLETSGDWSAAGLAQAPTHVYLRLEGPGRVAIQSSTGHEGRLRMVRDHSPATERAW